MAKIPKVDFASVFETFETTESSTDKETYCRTNLLAVDALTGGLGLPRRRLIHLWAPNGMGKTTVLMTLARALVKMGEGVLWAGIEPSQKLAEDMGLRKDGKDVPNFKYCDVSFYDELQKLTDAFLNSPHKWMIIDSITAVSPSPEKIQKDGIEAATIGVDAKIQSVYFRLYHNLLKQTDKSIIYITQSRMKIATKWGEESGEDSAGGMASKFYSDMRFTIIGNANVSAADMGGQGTGKATAGKKGWLVAEKIRHAPPQTRVPVTIIFGKGLSNIQSMKSYLDYKGVITKSGSFFSIEWDGKKDSVQGKVGMYDWIKANQASIMESFYKDVDGYFKWLQETNGGKEVSGD